MVNLYADLVQKGLRSLDPDNGITMVPDVGTLRADVRAELERRGYYEIAE